MNAASITEQNASLQQVKFFDRKELSYFNCKLRKNNFATVSWGILCHGKLWALVMKTYLTIDASILVLTVLSVGRSCRIWRHVAGHWRQSGLTVDSRHWSWGNGQSTTFALTHQLLHATTYLRLDRFHVLLTGKPWLHLHRVNELINGSLTNIWQFKIFKKQQKKSDQQSASICFSITFKKSQVVQLFVWKFSIIIFVQKFVLPIPGMSAKCYPLHTMPSYHSPLTLWKHESTSCNNHCHFKILMRQQKTK